MRVSAIVRALTSVAINRYLREERGSEAFVTASS